MNGAGCGTGCDSATRNTLGGTPRYIGVRGQVTYNFITPVNKIFVGENTKVIKFGQIVPVGITVCPAGQALTSAGVCAASTVTCGAGQFLTASGACSAAVPVCNGAGQALQFDGANWGCAAKDCISVNGPTGDAESVAWCPSDFPYLESGQTLCEVDGMGDPARQLCSNNNTGYVHTAYADYTNNLFRADCANKDGGGSCGRAIARCCNRR